MFQRIEEAFATLAGKREASMFCTCRPTGTSQYPNSATRSDTQPEPTETYNGTGDFGAYTRYARPRMEDVFVTVRVPLATAFAGGEVVARVDVWQKCSQCHGKGKCHSPLFTCSTCHGTGKTPPIGRWGSGICPTCDGDGRSKSRCWTCNGSGAGFAAKDIEVHIPPRTGPGVVLFIKGAGHTGIDGSAPGDVHVAVDIDWWQSGYQLTGLAIEGPAEVDCLAAVLGGAVDVVVLGSTVTVDIPHNVRSGTRITVPQAGLKDGFGHAGDLRLNVVLHVLNPIDAHTRERLRAILVKAASEST